MHKVFLITAILIAALFAGLGWLFSSEPEPKQVPALESVAVTPSFSPSPSLSPLPKASPSPIEKQIPRKLDHKVPFTVQAPLAQWDDPIFQDACEEASILMAAAWAGAADFSSPLEVTKAIKSMVEYQKEQYACPPGNENGSCAGAYQDRSSRDTAQFMKDYFHHQNVAWRENVAADDIIAELAAGNLVIVPADGRALKNPHFTQPGPDRHMLVIRGYDNESKEFITNDPGTRFGEGYRYDQKVLVSAIRDYHTGYHIPITGMEKNMIVVAKGE